MKTTKNTARNLKWLNMYVSGRSIAEIASEAGYSVTNVYYAIKSVSSNGIPLQHRRKQQQEVSDASEYKTMIIHGKVYVLRRFQRLTNELPQPDFLGKGMALCAVLRDGETLDSWHRSTGSRTNLNESV